MQLVSNPSPTLAPTLAPIAQPLACCPNQVCRGVPRRMVRAMDSRKVKKLARHLPLQPVRSTAAPAPEETSGAKDEAPCRS